LGYTKNHMNVINGLPYDPSIYYNVIVHYAGFDWDFFPAFEDMLESPTNSALYISDHETGPVLLQISRIVQGFARW